MKINDNKIKWGKEPSTPSSIINTMFAGVGGALDYRLMYKAKD